MKLDRITKKLLKDVESGKMYKEYLDYLKESGLNPDKPLTLTFDDGHTEETLPMKDMMPHIKPPNKRNKKKGKR